MEIPGHLGSMPLGMVALTPNSISKIVSGVMGPHECGESPLMQVLQMDVLPDGSRLVVLSDGSQHVRGILEQNGVCDLKPTAASGGCVLVELRNWRVGELHGQPVVHVSDMAQVGMASGMIGDPISCQQPQYDVIPATKAKPEPTRGVSNNLYAVAARLNAKACAADASAKPSTAIPDKIVETPTQRRSAPARKRDDQDPAVATSRRFSVESLPIMPIMALTPHTSRWRLRVRVLGRTGIRHFTNARGPGRLFSVDLVDAAGSECRASIFGAAADIWYEAFAPKAIVEISGGSIKPGNPRFTNHPIEITLDEKASVFQVDEDKSLPTLRYHFTSLSQLPRTPAGIRVDVRAAVMEAMELTSVRTSKGDVRMKRAMTLADGSGVSCRFTVWGSQAEGLDGLTIGSVLFVKSAKVSDWGGGRSLDSLESGVIEVDPDDSRAFEIKRWYVQQRSGNHQVLSLSGGEKTAVGAGRRLLAECLDEDAALLVPSAAQGERERVVHAHRVVPATVLQILHERPPFYLACTSEVPGQDGRLCNRKVEPLGQSHQCSAGHACSSPCHRYTLAVLIADASASRVLVSAFDDEGHLLLGCPASRVADLWAQRDMGDLAAGKALTQIFKHAENRRWSLLLRSRKNDYGGKQHVRRVISECKPLDFVADAANMLRMIRAGTGFGVAAAAGA